MGYFKFSALVVLLGVSGASGFVAGLGSYVTTWSTVPAYQNMAGTAANLKFTTLVSTSKAMTVDWAVAAGVTCMCRLRASKIALSAAPGTYGAYVAGSLYSDVGIADSELEGYGHHWVSCDNAVTGTTDSTKVAYSGLADGYYMFTASCWDNNPGNPYQEENFAFKVDTVAPTAVVTPAADYDPSPSTASAFSFTVVATDSHGNTDSITTAHLPNPAYSSVTPVTDTDEMGLTEFYYRLDGGSVVSVGTGTAGALTSGSIPVTKTIALTGVTAGGHCIEVYTKDPAGNIEGGDAYDSGVMYCWTVESFAQGSATNAGGCTFSYSLNSASYVSTAAVQYADVSSLPDGTNTFTIMAFDQYANPTASYYLSTFTWTVDTLKPNTAFTAGGLWADQTNYITSTAGTFSYKSSESGSFFKYQVDGGAFVNDVFGGAVTTSSQVFAAGTFGVSSCSGTSHSFGVKAVDPVGNIGDVTTSTFTVEPIDTVLYLRVNGADAVDPPVAPSSTATFRVSSYVDAATPSTFGYEYKVDGGNWIKGVHFPEFGVKGLSDGVHTVTARAVSASGCHDPSAKTVSFTVDTTAPVTELVCPASPSNQASLMVHGTVTDATVDTSGTQYKLGSAGSYSTLGDPVVDSNGFFSVSLANLIEGKYTLYVQSTDRAGKLGAEATCTWIVDFGLPETTVVAGPPTPAYKSSELTFRFACSENDCTYKYSLDGLAYVHTDTHGVTFQPPADASGRKLLAIDELPVLAGTNFGNTELSALATTPGVHTLKVIAIDAADNEDPTAAAYTWTVFDGSNYGEYCEACSFTTSGPSPMTFVPLSQYYVHGDMGKSTIHQSNTKKK